MRRRRSRRSFSKTVFESQFCRRYCQTFSTGFSSGAREGRKIGVTLLGTSSLPVVCHPARSSSSTAWAPTATLREIRRGEAASCRCLRRAAPAPLRRLGLDRSRRTDRRCRNAGRRAALAAFRVWPIAGQGRSSGRSELYPGTRFRPASSRAALRDELSARVESFFERFDNPFVLSRMTGPRADVREAELLQKLSDIARMKVDAEPLGDDALEIDPSPADNAVLLTIGAGLDDPGEFSPLLGRQARLRTLGPVVEEPVRARGVEAMNPVAQRLPVHPADLRRCAAIHPISNRSQRKKPPALIDVLRPAGGRPKRPPRLVFPQSHPCWHCAD